MGRRITGSPSFDSSSPLIKLATLALCVVVASSTTTSVPVAESPVGKMEDKITFVLKVFNWVVVVFFAGLALYALWCFAQVGRRTRASSDRAFYVLCFCFCVLRGLLLLIMSVSDSVAKCLAASMDLMQVVLSIPTVLFLGAHTFVLYTWLDLRNVLAMISRTHLPLAFIALGSVFGAIWFGLSIGAFIQAAADNFTECSDAVGPDVIVPAAPPVASDYGKRFRDNPIVFALTLNLGIYYFLVAALYLIVGVALDRTLARVHALGQTAVVWKVRFVGAINGLTQLARGALVILQMFPIGDFGDTTNRIVYSPWVFYGLLEVRRRLGQSLSLSLSAYAPLGSSQLPPFSSLLLLYLPLLNCHPISLPRS